MDIEGKVVAVTGGASGLGYAAATQLAAKGAKVALIDLNVEKAQESADALGNGAIAVKADVSNEDSVTAAFDAIQNQIGDIRVLVNSAGLGGATLTVGKEFAPYPLEQFKFIVNVNLIGTFNCLRIAASKMAQTSPVTDDGERGVVVNVASVAAYDGQRGQAAYSASKGGVVGMTLPIARDLQRYGIRVCTIAPGIFDTPLMMGAPDVVRDPLLKMTQFPRRFGQPNEFGQLVVHICENGYLNGETIRLDAGIRMAPK